MYLELGLKVIYDERYKALYLENYKSNISSDGYSFAFGLEDFNKVSHALEVFNEECVEAIKRTNERLLADGFDKIQMPQMRNKKA